MPELVIPARYAPLPAQSEFHRSTAVVRGYGGAMGGGKSRALCEEIFEMMLAHPGVKIPIFRQVHGDITLSTRDTFINHVLPGELRSRKDLIRIKASGGDDFVELWNGSSVHFVGLDRPGRWFSTELGSAGFDEAHEISERDVLTINSRIRQRCPDCISSARVECGHYPHRLMLTFNPSYPGHWLQQWFILGAQRTEWGYRKEKLVATEAEDDADIGDAEFFVARVTENPYVSETYVKRQLGGLGKMERRRYLDGLWEHIGGNSFFDAEALGNAAADAMEHVPLVKECEPEGDITGLNRDKLPSVMERRGGRMELYKTPVRWHVTDDGQEHKAHRYVVAVDASSGAGADYSAIQVIDVEEFEQVAEWQGKVDPDRLAEVAFLTAVVWNGATLAPEITGGWGFAVVKRCQQMIGNWKGPQGARPQIFTRPIMDRISQKWTDLVGWDTNTKTRAQMLDVLEQGLRDESFQIHGQRTLAEMAAFAIPMRLGDVGDYRSPRAQKGANDDLVIAAAIGFTVAMRLPRNTRQPARPPQAPAFSATGY